MIVRCARNSKRVDSEIGTMVLLAQEQKYIAFLLPVVLLFLVVGAMPMR